MFNEWIAFQQQNKNFCLKENNKIAEDSERYAERKAVKSCELDAKTGVETERRPDRAETG